MASSRSLAGRGLPSAAAKSLPRNVLRDDADQHGSTEDSELLESLQQLPVMLGGLGEAEPWINDQLLGGYASALGCVELGP